MGTIGDLITLVSKLTDSVQDRKFAAELREVQRMISALQAEHSSLHTENLKLRTENAELKQQVAALKQGMPKADTGGAQAGEKMDDVSEKLLAAIANSEVPKDALRARLGLSPALGDYHFDILKERHFILEAFATGEGMFYRATAEGRKYLATRGLL